MESLTQMVAIGWPLALAGFFVGALAGVFMSGGRKNDEAKLKLKPGEDALSALQAEINAAKELLQKEAEDDAASEASLKNLDEAVKRANGRLKIVMNGLSRGS